jgi:hypothetical protein
MPGSAPARIYPANVTHAIRGRVTFAQGVTTGVEIGTLPAGAFVLRTAVYIPTAFNGASVTMNVGSAATPAAFAATAGVLPAATGYKPNLVGTGMGDTLLADTPVVVTIGGTLGTTGEAQIVVEYYPQKT